MTQEQIRILKLLGYTTTRKPGAILKFDSFSKSGKYIMEDGVFEDVLERFWNRTVFAIETQSTSRGMSQTGK